MGKLSVTLQTDAIGINAVDSTQTAILNVKDITIATTPAKDMISTDPNNDLKLGSDNKLLVDNSDIKQQIANKADSADLALINESLSQKASQSDLGKVQTLAQVNNLNISLKADQVDLDVTNTQVAEHTQSLLTKADKSALEQLMQLVGTKADQNYVINEIARITGNAPAALDTLSEIAVQLGKDESQLQTLLDAVGNRLRFDAPQSLNSAQQQTARDNINAEQKGVAKGLVDAITPSSIGAATAAQGTKADTAIQSGDLAPVALTGLFSSLGGINKLFDVVYNAYSIGSNIAIKSTDTLGQMLGKLQAQVSANASDIVNKVDKTSVIDVAHGGTGATSATTARTNLGLGLVDFLFPRIGDRYYYPNTRYNVMFYKPAASVTALTGVPRKWVFYYPFIAFEDATINSLELNITTAQTGGYCLLGIYSANNLNYPSQQLFASGNLDCSTTGIKSAPCNVPIKRGTMYFLAYVGCGTDTYINFTGWSLNHVPTIAGSENAVSNGYMYLMDWVNQESLPTTANVTKPNGARGWNMPNICFTVI